MKRVDQLTTPRLLLRRWQEGDRAPFAALNADSSVMEHMPGCQSPAESEATVDRIEAGFERNWYGFWAVERTDTGSFIGFVGIADVPFDATFTPAVEIGWRLARAAWGHGFATEAAAAVMSIAFDELDMEDLVSFTVPLNLRSRAVMRRIGMRHDPADDFDHPRLARDHPLSRHVLYRISRP